MLTKRLDGVPATLHDRMDRIGDAFREASEGDEGCTFEHLFHAGCYVRTMRVPKDKVFVSEQMRIATVLIVSGDCAFTDTETAVRITGYKVLTGAPMRQSIVRTFEDTVFTAFFATNAKTQDEAEAEAVFRPDRLLHISKEKNDELCNSSDGRSGGRRRS